MESPANHPDDGANRAGDSNGAGASGEYGQFVRRAVIVLLLAVAVGLLAALLVTGTGILLSAFAGILLAIFLRALTDPLKRATSLPDGWALLMVLLLLFGGMGLAGWLLAPQVVEQAEELSERVPEIVEEVQDYLADRRWGRWVLSQTGQDSGSGQNRAAGGEQADPEAASDVGLAGLPDGAGERVGGLLGTLSTWSTYFLTAFFVGLFAAANPPLYREGFVHLFPMRHRARLRDLLDDIGYSLRWWLIGQLFAMLVIGASTTIVLWLLDVPLAIILGLIVGLLGFIPYLGPLIGLVPVAAIAATQDVTTLAYVLVAYTAVQMLEGYVATPLIQQGTVHLPPATTVGMQMLMGSVIGVIGIVLATPLAAVLLVVTRFYRTDVLHDPEAAKSG